MHYRWDSAMNDLVRQLACLSRLEYIKYSSGNKLKALAFLACALTTSVVCAGDVEKDLISIESDVTEIERGDNVATYKGSAKLRDKKLVIEAEQISVIRKNDQITHYISLGQPAKIWIRQDDPDAVDIEGNSLNYDLNEGLITINGHPILKQNENIYRGKVEGCIKFHLKDNSVSQCGESPFKYP
jgi:lipopolysaccharide transport protein LptA